MSISATAAVLGYWGATGQKSSIRATEGQNRVKKTHFSTHRSYEEPRLT
jgi:hypothetical protein